MLITISPSRLIRCTWLTRLTVYHDLTLPRALLKEPGVGISLNGELDELYEYVRNERSRLTTQLSRSSTSSDSLLPVLMALFLGNSVQSLSPGRGGINPWRLPPSTILHKLLPESYQAGTTLVMVETKLQHKSDCLQKITSVELQEYLTIYRKTKLRLQEITGCEVPLLPPFHNLLLLTRGKAVFPLDLNEARNLAEKDFFGRSLWHLALDLEADENVLLSISKFRGTPHYQDIWGRYPIHIACSGSSEVVVGRLLCIEADLFVKDHLGRSTLDYACGYGTEGIVRLLLRVGADVNAPTSTGKKPLLYAIASSRPEIARLLLENGAAVNIQDDELRTPLIYAIMYRSEETVRLLLRNGADANISCGEYGTPLNYARSKSFAFAHFIRQSMANHRELYF